MSPPVLCALSGGVDSSVAAASVVGDGTHASGVTLLLWGGERSTKSCSTADAVAARAAADRLGIDLHVVDWTEQFDRVVVGPFVSAARRGKTMNPCLACNRSFKLDGLVAWADDHGFECIATGHYARVADGPDGPVLARAIDAGKDQTYVLWEATPDQLARYRFPLGALTKDEVRARADELGLPAAHAAESQDLCFSRADVLEAAGGVRRVPVVDGADGPVVGDAPVELVTVGQRRGLDVALGERRYVTDISDTRVVLGRAEDLATETVALDGVRLHAPTLYEHAEGLQTRCSAHGPLADATVDIDDTSPTANVRWHRPQRRVAPGQAVVVYDLAGHVVAGGYAA